MRCGHLLAALRLNGVKIYLRHNELRSCHFCCVCVEVAVTIRRVDDLSNFLVLLLQFRLQLTEFLFVQVLLNPNLIFFKHLLLLSPLAKLINYD